MRTVDPGSPIDLTSVPRALLSLTLGVLRTVERTMARDGRLPTARDNAWAAVCADRDRARQRDEIRRMVAALAAAQSVANRTVGTAANLANRPTGVIRTAAVSRPAGTTRTNGTTRTSGTARSTRVTSGRVAGARPAR